MNFFELISTTKLLVMPWLKFAMFDHGYVDNFQIKNWAATYTNIKTFKSLLTISTAWLNDDMKTTVSFFHKSIWCSSQLKMEFSISRADCSLLSKTKHTKPLYSFVPEVNKAKFSIVCNQVLTNLVKHFWNLIGETMYL